MPTLPLTRLARSVPLGPPPVHAFAAGARTCDPEGDDLLTWLLPAAPEQTHGLQLRVRGGGLPTPREVSTTDLSLWQLPDLTRARRGPAARALLSMVAAVPLALAPAVAQAGDEAEEEPTEQEAGDEETAQPTSAAVDLSGVDQTEDLATTGDLLWTSLVHSRVELALNDGAKLFGRVLTQAPDEIAVILDQDGFVMRVPKDSILRIRVLELPDGVELVREEVAERVKTPPDGKAGIVVGTILSATGGGMLTVYAVGAAVDSSFAYFMAPMAVVGGWTLGGGIPILITGLVQKDRYGKWEDEHHAPEPELEVSMAPTLGGWSGGLSLRW